jgi:hypothetical protein
MENLVEGKRRKDEGGRMKESLASQLSDFILPLHPFPGTV